MNPFQVLESVQRDYRKYVESLQLIKSDDIPPVLEEAIERGELLWGPARRVAAGAEGPDVSAKGLC